MHWVSWDFNPSKKSDDRDQPATIPVDQINPERPGATRNSIIIDVRYLLSISTYIRWGLRVLLWRSWKKKQVRLLRYPRSDTLKTTASPSTTQGRWPAIGASATGVVVRWSVKRPGMSTTPRENDVSGSTVVLPVLVSREIFLRKWHPALPVTLTLGTRTPVLSQYMLSIC